MHLHRRGNQAFVKGISQVVLNFLYICLWKFSQTRKWTEACISLNVPLFTISAKRLLMPNIICLYVVDFLVFAQTYAEEIIYS